MQKYRRLALVLGSSLVLSACANLSAGNLFSHYSAQNSELHRSLQRGDYPSAEQALPDAVAGEILDNFEKGRVYLLNQDYPASQQAFELSDQALREQQDLATISVSQSAQSLSALAVNDNLSSYQPADYELGFLHLYLGLNYVKQNDLEGALVEMRRANQVQEQARKAREKELLSAQAQMQQQGLTPNLGSVLSHYPDAGTTLQAVQNGYLLYLSALLYETEGELNSAYVDYRRALAVMPQNDQVIDGTKRVAKRLAMNDDLRQLEARYGQAKYLDRQRSRVIVIDERGVVDALQGWKQALPLSDSRGNGAWYSMALPYYPKKRQIDQYSSVQLNQQPLAASQLTDVNLMAQRDLSERMPSLIIRQALRVWAKDQLRRQAAKDDDVANLLFNVWNTLTEQPDTRSWLSLPADVYSASLEVDPGEQVLIVNEQPYRFRVEQGNTVLVWLSRQGNNVIIWHKQLGNIR